MSNLFYTIPRVDLGYDKDNKEIFLDANTGRQVMPAELVTRYNELATKCEQQDLQIRNLRSVEHEQ